MEFPFGHHTHTRHHRREEEETEYPPPPPSSFRDYPPPSYEPPPPPPPSFGGGIAPHHPPPPPPRFGHHPPTSYSSYYGEASPVGEGGTHVHHSSHHVWGGPSQDYHSIHPQPLPSHNFNSPDYHHSHGGGYSPPQPQPQAADSAQYSPHLPSTHHHHHHHNRPQSSELDGKPTVRVFTKARTDYSLTIRDGKVILAPSDPSDPFQHWIKDEKYSTRVKDEEGFPSFALVNKAIAQAMKHSIGATHPVQLIPYNSNGLDESILWTQSKDLGDGYRTIRMVNNIRLNVDAFHGDKNHGGVHDGTTIVLWEWKKGENQRWKIIPY